MDIKENHLLGNCVNGDSDSFDKLIALYRKRLYSYLFRFFKNRETAEDAFQETLINVWKGFKKYNNNNRFASWMFAIAHNTAMDLIRKNKVREIVIPEEDITAAANADNPHTVYMQKETEEIIKKAVENLPLKQKQVFLLRQHGELSFKEIADITKEPLNTVLSHMNYAVKKLKQALGKYNEII